MSAVMKSYDMLNMPLRSADVTSVAKVAEQLLAQGFVIITARFGERPSITVKPTAACQQLESVCTGQHGAGGRMYRSYAAGVDGVSVIWHKPIQQPINH